MNLYKARNEEPAPIPLHGSTSTATRAISRPSIPQSIVFFLLAWLTKSRVSCFPWIHSSAFDGACSRSPYDSCSVYAPTSNLR